MEGVGRGIIFYTAVLHRVINYLIGVEKPKKEKMKSRRRFFLGCLSNWREVDVTHSISRELERNEDNSGLSLEIKLSFGGCEPDFPNGLKKLPAKAKADSIVYLSAILQKSFDYFPSSPKDSRLRI
jgi:hypothetical protein